jgi:Flp pilus assembly pilin Flp
MSFIPPENGASTPRKEKVMKTLLVRLVQEEEAQDLIEYALLAAFISLAALAVLMTLGPVIKGKFQSVQDALK